MQPGVFYSFPWRALLGYSTASRSATTGRSGLFLNHRSGAFSAALCTPCLDGACGHCIARSHIVFYSALGFAFVRVPRLGVLHLTPSSAPRMACFCVGSRAWKLSTSGVPFGEVSAFVSEEDLVRTEFLLWWSYLKSRRDAFHVAVHVVVAVVQHCCVGE